MERETACKAAAIRLARIVTWAPHDQDLKEEKMKSKRKQAPVPSGSVSQSAEARPLSGAMGVRPSPDPLARDISSKAGARRS